MSKLDNSGKHRLIDGLNMATTVSVPLILVGGIAATVGIGRHDMAIEDEMNRVGCLHLQNGTSPIEDQRALKKKLITSLFPQDDSVTGMPKMVPVPLHYGKDIALVIGYCYEIYQIKVATGCAAKSILQIEQDGYAKALPPNYLPEARAVDVKEVQACCEGEAGK